MNNNEIQDLIKFVAKSGVSEVEIQSKDFKITIKTGLDKKAQPPMVVAASPAVVSVPAPAPLPVAAAPAATPAAETKKAAVKEDSKYVTIKSPMIGTFYRSSSPDKPQFVNVGDDIKKGKVICIIEAMKLFNEIESEYSGKIVKILVDDSKPVEYDQPLFLIDPA